MPRLVAFAPLAAPGRRAQDMDPANPTCPRNPGWSTDPTVNFRVVEGPGARPVLLAEGAIDTNMLPRLRAALDGLRGDEIWLRSVGGDARTGNQTAALIRRSGAMARIPAG